MEAKFPRTFVDLNRSHLELDPNLISGDFYFEKTARNIAGLGVIPRFSGSGKAIYNKTISIDNALRRLERYYFPYHNFLKSLLLESKKSKAMPSFFHITGTLNFDFRAVLL